MEPFTQNQGWFYCDLWLFIFTACSRSMYRTKNEELAESPVAAEVEQGLEPEAIAFEDYIYWCPEAKFELIDGRPWLGGKRLGSRLSFYAISLR